MASAQPLRCLVRPNAVPRIQLLANTTAAFSTTSHVQKVSAKPASKKAAPKAIQTVRSPNRFSNKKTGVTTKKAQPGERKAFRKRIQLSNNSALAVEGLDVLEAEALLQADSAGKMVALPDQLVDQLRALEAFKHTQTWNLFRRPHVLVREETVKLMNMLKESAEKKSALKTVLTGRKLSGKSIMLLQAMSYALQNNWVAIHLPEGQDLTNGQTDYSPIPNTKPIQFSQPVYCLNLLQSILKANNKVLSNLKAEKDWSSSINLEPGGTLAELIANCKESEYAWPTFQALWTELTLPGRPPVLFTLDGLSHINKISEYRDPAFNTVHSHDLTLVGTFVDVLSGKNKLPNGGAVIAATSGNNTFNPPSQELALSQLEAGQAGKEVPKPNPYERKYDNRVYDALKNAHVLRVDGVSREEGRTLMEYWGASGLTKPVVDSRNVAEKWALGGHGVVGEMERMTLLSMRM